MRKTLLASAFIATTFVFAFAASDGAALYNKCKACHGADGSKVPAGAKTAVKGQSAADLEKKLTGYKDGSFGGEKKATMQRMAANLSPEDIKALAQYMSGL
ncbi:c-type cytochrome [Geovibrio thiophilus]|uniref:C-type cytochrome n=1 Tax=Geovibrio thiophilus TaxID=139438 RepID=A0A3R5XWV4_9BACT|nr:c-type cytochrome [Geovibrio thiophilus]QAR32600.1 c-type cytochrome [Geovibrio thiophilus]